MMCNNLYLINEYSLCQNEDVVWKFVISDEGMKTWLGNIDSLDKNDPKSYLTADGVKGDINVLKPYSHLRLTWHPKTWDKKSSLQLRLTDKGQKTVLTFHHEGLPSAKERDMMREHWTKVVERLLQLLRNKISQPAPKLSD